MTKVSVQQPLLIFCKYEKEPNKKERKFYDEKG